MNKLEQAEMPLFSKTFDFLAWLTPATNHFPRIYRHTITRRLLDAALDFQECILEANSLRGPHRLSRLQHAEQRALCVPQQQQPGQP